jgi:hypothetical protein
MSSAAALETGRVARKNVETVTKGTAMRKLYRFCSCLGFGAAIAALLSACVKTEVKPELKPGTIKGSFKDQSLVKKKFKKLKNYYLVLYPVGNDKVIPLDENAEVKVRLANFARKKIRIDEWYMDVPNNVILYYRPFDLKVRRFIPSEWEKVSPEIKGQARRFELVLMPKNSVLITRRLDFLKDIKLPKGTPRRFLMLAELNLTSVKVRSSMFSIEVKQK